MGKLRHYVRHMQHIMSDLANQIKNLTVTTGYSYIEVGIVIRLKAA